MAIAEIIGTIKNSFNIIEKATKFINEIAKFMDKKELENAIKNLKAFHFVPGGALSILEECLDKDEVLKNDVFEALAKQLEVTSIPVDLAMAQLSSYAYNTPIDFSEYNDINLIVYQKQQIREKLMDLIGEAQFETGKEQSTSLSKEEIDELIGTIKEFNHKIEKIYDGIRSNLLKRAGA